VGKGGDPHGSREECGTGRDGRADKNMRGGKGVFFTRKSCWTMSGGELGIGRKRRGKRVSCPTRKAAFLAGHGGR